MADEALRRRSCLSKSVYTTRKRARDVKTRLTRELGVTGQLEVYHCAFCRLFHIGHSRGQRRTA